MKLLWEANLKDVGSWHPHKDGNPHLSRNIARMKLVILCNHKLHSRTLHLLVTALDAKHDAQN